MTLKSPRETGPPDFDDECTKVGPPSGAVLDSLRSRVEPNVQQAALDELVDLTIEFEEPAAAQPQTVPYGAVLSEAPIRRPLFPFGRRPSLVVVFLLTAMTLVVLAILGSVLIRR